MPGPLNIEGTLAHLSGAAPKVPELRAAITGATVGDIRSLMDAVNRNPDAARNLRAHEDVRQAIQAETTTALNAARANLNSVRAGPEGAPGVKQRLVEAAEASQRTIDQHAQEIQNLLNGTPSAPTAPVQNVVMRAANGLLSRLSNIPFIGPMLANLSPSKIWEGLQGALYNVTAMMGNSVPFFGKGLQEWAAAKLDLRQAAKIVKDNLPAGRTFDDKSLTPQALKAFTALPRTAPATWQTDLPTLITKYLAATPGSLTPITWEQIVNANTAEAGARLAEENALKTNVIAQFGTDKVKTVTFAPGGTSAKRGATGPFEVTMPKEQANAATGALEKDEAKMLKRLLALADSAVNGVVIAAAGTPTAFEKKDGAVTVTIPVGVNTGTETQMKDIALALKNNADLSAMRFDPRFRGAADARFKLGMNASFGLELTWNAIAQATAPAALAVIPRDLNATTPLNKQWRWNSSASWSEVTTPTP